MKIIFVTGKGGVGKSAVAAALAFKQAQQEIKTLLVELGDQSFYQDYFSLPKVEYKPTKLFENLDVSLWSGQNCLKEYALYLLKIERLYKVFFENPISKALINIAPALPELAIVGKITSGPPRNVGPKMPYECIIVDSFASGHFISLLQAPKGFTSAIGIGPIGEQSRAMSEILENPEICSYYVVCTPEELPVVEGIELAEKIQNCTGQSAQILLNRWVTFPELNQALEETVDFKNQNMSEFQQNLRSVVLRQNEMKKKLEKFQKIKALPFVYESDPMTLMKVLEKELPS